MNGRLPWMRMLPHLIGCGPGGAAAGFAAAGLGAAGAGGVVCASGAAAEQTKTAMIRFIQIPRVMFFRTRNGHTRAVVTVTEICFGAWPMASSAPFALENRGGLLGRRPH